MVKQPAVAVFSGHTQCITHRLHGGKGQAAAIQDQPPLARHGQCDLDLLLRLVCIFGIGSHPVQLHQIEQQQKCNQPKKHCRPFCAQQHRPLPASVWAKGKGFMQAFAVFHHQAAAQPSHRGSVPAASTPFSHRQMICPRPILMRSSTISTSCPMARSCSAICSPASRSSCSFLPPIH